MYSCKHECTLTMAGKLICTGYASLSLIFSLSFLPRKVLANWMETTSPNTVDVLQVGRHPVPSYTTQHGDAHTCTLTHMHIHTYVLTYLGKYLPIEPSAMVTTANGSPAEGHVKVIVQFVKLYTAQSSCLHAKVM